MEGTHRQGGRQDHPEPARNQEIVQEIRIAQGSPRPRSCQRGTVLHIRSLPESAAGLDHQQGEHQRETNVQADDAEIAQGRSAASGQRVL